MAYNLPPSIKNPSKGGYGHHHHSKHGKHGYAPKYYGYSAPRYGYGGYGYGYGYYPYPRYPYPYLPLSLPYPAYDNCPLNTQTICDYKNPLNCVCVPF